MIEVRPNLFVSSQSDCANFHGAVVHACKDPWHRQFVGYTGRALPKDHPEYLFAIRDDEIALNMVDVDKPEYFAEDMINSALLFINFYLNVGKPVLIHCNQGESRAPGLAMLAMKYELPDSFEEAEATFRQIYPMYNPKNGIREYVRMHWRE